ncbi:hypothetical protein D9M68_959710 [compost metagenome]
MRHVHADIQKDIENRARRWDDKFPTCARQLHDEAAAGQFGADSGRGEVLHMAVLGQQVRGGAGKAAEHGRGTAAIEVRAGRRIAHQAFDMQRRAHLGVHMQMHALAVAL